MAAQPVDDQRAASGQQPVTSRSTEPISIQTTESLSNREAYNVATDLGAGPNIRWRDNLAQTVAILMTTLVGVGVGGSAAGWAVEGILIGALIGLLVGLFASGTFLMIYRLVKHIRGDHR